MTIHNPLWVLAVEGLIAGWAVGLVAPGQAIVCLWLCGAYLYLTH
jgi:hypothetical protein